VLKAKLAELERQKRAEELDELRGGVQNVGFGSQIRSYVLHPYQMVKDLRSEHETGNVAGVLDGDLDELLEAELRRRVREASARADAADAPTRPLAGTLVRAAAPGCAG
jgi:peptide chain release factor 2